MRNSLLDIFKIDNVGKRISVRIIFAVMLLMRVSVYLFPIGDNDFSEFYSWFMAVSSDMDKMARMSFSDIPLTQGNLLHLLSIIVIDYLCVLGGFLYIALFIRDYRLSGMSPLRPLDPSNIILRLIIIGILTAFLYIPMLIMVLYLFLIFIIIFPCMALYPACFLSGDSGFFDSVVQAVNRTKGYFIVNMRNFSIILLGYLILDGAASLIGHFLPAAGYVLRPLVAVFALLSCARYIGMVYCRMIEVPGNRRPPARPAA